MTLRSRLLAVLALPALVLPLLTLSAVLAPAAAAARPAAVVVLGDSVASGEGAGDYVPGTRGEGGDWCHRSVHAYVHRTALAPVGVNLACSGADSAAVAFGPTTHHTEPSQAQQLIAVARSHRVTTVVLQLGANDDAALTDTGIACIRAFLDINVPPCRETLGPLVPDRMAATAVKVEAALGDVRRAMTTAGYARGSYVLVVASYPSPVTEAMVPLAAGRGCPFSRADAAWGRTVLFPALSTALHTVAGRTGAVFLDLSRATEGYEACARSPRIEEWQRRITVDPYALAYGGLGALGYRLWQESYHPSPVAHAEIGRCVGDLVRAHADTGVRSGACVAAPDGRAHLDIGSLVGTPT